MLDYIQIVLESSQRSGEPKSVGSAQMHFLVSLAQALASRHMKSHTHFPPGPQRNSPTIRTVGSATSEGLI